MVIWDRICFHWVGICCLQALRNWSTTTATARSLKNKQVTGVVEALFGVACAEIKKNCIHWTKPQQARAIFEEEIGVEVVELLEKGSGAEAIAEATFLREKEAAEFAKMSSCQRGRCPSPLRCPRPPPAVP